MHQTQAAAEPSLRRYLDTIAASKPLSRGQEVALAARIKEGDMAARDELVSANLRFVIVVAKGYQHRGLPFLELISAGNLGLITAAERFDGTRGFKFISYAVWWIKQSIQQTLDEQARTVRLPTNKTALLRHIAKASGQLSQQLEAEPTVEEIATELGVPSEEVLATTGSARAARSLEATFDEDDEYSLLNTLMDTSQDAPDADALCQSAKALLTVVLNGLSEREHRILRLYFGLEGGEALNLEQIGALLGVTRERIRQIKETALNQLRHPSRARALMDLIEDI